MDAPSGKYRLLILGVGNLLRKDDGIGIHVAHQLARFRMPQGVEVFDAGTEVLTLLARMKDASKVVFLDAVDMGGKPGTVRIFAEQDVKTASEAVRTSLHEITLPDVLLLASLQDVSPEIAIVGIQPKDLGWGAGLSLELERAIPRIVECVLAEIRRWCTSTPPEFSFSWGRVAD